jgi:hypothetical protein
MDQVIDVRLVVRPLLFTALAALAFLPLNGSPRRTRCAGAGLPPTWRSRRSGRSWSGWAWR